MLKHPSHKEKNSISSKAGVAIQPKLEINSPGDKYEEEADAMAEKVMRMKDNSNGIAVGLI